MGQNVVQSFAICRKINMEKETAELKPDSLLYLIFLSSLSFFLGVK